MRKSLAAIAVERQGIFDAAFISLPQTLVETRLIYEQQVRRQCAAGLRAGFGVVDGRECTGQRRSTPAD
jgi:hypothetical protein